MPNSSKNNSKESYAKSLPLMETSFKETEELVAIFAKSIVTAKNNHKLV